MLHRRVLADIRVRGYGAWRFDDARASLHDRLASVLASVEPTALVARRLGALMTMVTLESVASTLEIDLGSTEFVVLPTFGRTASRSTKSKSTWAEPRRWRSASSRRRWNMRRNC